MAAPDLVASNLHAATLAPLRRADRAVPRGLSEGATAAEASTDFLISSLAMFAARLFCASPTMTLPHQAMREDLGISAVFGMVVCILMQREGGYRNGTGLLRIRETERAIRIPIQSLLVLVAICLLLGIDSSGRMFLAAGATALPLLALEKQMVASVVCRLRRETNRLPQAVIYGAGADGRSVLSTLLHSPRLGFQPVAVVSDHPGSYGGALSALGYRNRGAVAILPGPLSPSLLNSLKCDLLLVTARGLSTDQLDAAKDSAEQAGAHIAILGERPDEDLQRERLDFDGLHFASNIERGNQWLYAAAKRITDAALSIALLMLLAPILLLIAILIRLDSPGPALFIQKRVGRNGELFTLFKFRSMYMDAPKYARSPTSSNDPRITRIGRVLRRLSLDELPQLLNVFTGTMSLVGPRPEMPFIVERYSAQQRRRLEVLPGITGLWQLSADRAFPIHQNLEYDLHYIRYRGFFMDLAILAHTVVFAMSGGI